MNPTAKGALAALDTFAEAWTVGDRGTLAALFTPKSALHSSAHGDVRGAADIASLFGADLDPERPLTLVTTNQYVGGDDDRAVLTSYLYAITPEGDPKPATFGGRLVADLSRHGADWRFDVLRLSIPWTDGDGTRFAKWTVPGREGWKPGDAAPAIVSELDSPWARGIPELDPDDLEQQLADFYPRYSWAMDQGDFALLRGCFTEDVYGTFLPMGDLKGRHEVIGQMKSFRRLWPWMQHFGRTLKMTIGESGTTAHLLVGRIIPQRPTAPSGEDLYGAHYELDLRREDGTWRISRFEYDEGWVTIREQ